jgi:hypothetical protein
MVGTQPLNQIDPNTGYQKGVAPAPTASAPLKPADQGQKGTAVYRMGPNGQYQLVQQPVQPQAQAPAPVQQQPIPTTLGGNRPAVAQQGVAPNAAIKASTAVTNINVQSHMFAGQLPAGYPQQQVPGQQLPAQQPIYQPAPQMQVAPTQVAAAPGGVNCTENYDDGSVYIGQKADGYRHGKGKFYYADGGMYDGEWKYGSMDGFGRLYYVSGTVAYEGEWREDKFCGKGTVYNELPIATRDPVIYNDFDQIGDFWLKYEGDFVDDNKHGVGTLYFTNNERYAGEFRNDVADGKGTFYRLDGTMIVGEWRSNRLVKLL